jgi:hypothetical protein
MIVRPFILLSMAFLTYSLTATQSNVFTVFQHTAPTGADILQLMSSLFQF